MLESEVINGVAEATPALSVAAPRAYDVEIVGAWDAARTRYANAFATGLATPFQDPGWLSSWFASVGAAHEVEPLIVFVAERDTGQAVAALPLIRHRANGLTIITFADLGVTDYNAPILGPAAPSTPEGAEVFWKAVIKALPKADLIELKKIPTYVRGRENPLALLHDVHPSHSPGFSVALPDDWEVYVQSLAKKFRKELRRSFRLFEKEGDTSLRRIETADEALRVLQVMNEQQRARLEEMGYRYVLDEEDYHAFYHRLVSDGLEVGTTILTALVCGNEIVAALLGVTDGRSFAMVRLSHAGGDWMKIGPGRLVIDRTMHALHAQGIRNVDFSIGDYPYKSGFGVAPSPLVDLISARSFRAHRHAARDLAKATVKRTLGKFGISLVPKTVRHRYRNYRASEQ